MQGVEFVAVNTDIQALYHNPAPKKITLGRTTRGLGAGANPDIGKRAAEEALEEIKAALEGTDMLFITAGLGGGTGTGAFAVIADAAKKHGDPHGRGRDETLQLRGVQAQEGGGGSAREHQGKGGHTLITIPNDKILSLIDKTTPLTEAFRSSTRSIGMRSRASPTLITVHGLVNVDFADVKAIMQDAGTALMGIGYGTGDSRAAEAARAAIDSPLLETSIHGAQGILFNITGGNDLSMFEVDEAAHASSRRRLPRRRMSSSAR